MGSPKCLMAICYQSETFTRKDATFGNSDPYMIPYPVAIWTTGPTNRYTENQTVAYESYLIGKKLMYNYTTQISLNANGASYMHELYVFVRYNNPTFGYILHISDATSNFGVLNHSAVPYDYWAAWVTPTTVWRDWKIDAYDNHFDIWANKVFQARVTDNSSLLMSGYPAVASILRYGFRFANLYCYDSGSSDTSFQFWLDDYDESTAAKINEIKIPGARGNRVQIGGSDSRIFTFTGEVTQAQHNMLGGASQLSSARYALDRLIASKALVYVETPYITTSGYLRNARGIKVDKFGKSGKFAVDLIEAVGGAIG